MKKRPGTLKKFSLFSDGTLIIIISLVTLLLQMISFATTWNGAKIYLEDIFPYASLLFAVAIQATAYFFSNALRGRIRPLKILALCLALCCSTYYSYIGIYNSVNSPSIYLQENYMRIVQNLEHIYTEASRQTMADAQDSLNTASSLIIRKYSALVSEQENIQACRSALSEVKSSYTSGLRAPRQSAYENYEDYAAAYQFYINSASQGKGVEDQAVREQVLASYGYTSMEQLNEAEQQNAASLNALSAIATNASDSQTDPVSDPVSDQTDPDPDSVSNQADPAVAVISEMTRQLSEAINASAVGTSLTSGDLSQLNILFQTAALCGYQGLPLSQLTTSLSQCAQISGDDLLPGYDALVAELPDGKVTDANTMDLKVSMDAQIMNALIKLNTLLPLEAQLSYTDSGYIITDLYLVPMQALKQPDTRMTAVFCLGVAGLIDALSVLFAVSLRGKTPLWKKRLLPACNIEDYEPLIYASLPDSAAPTHSLSDFLQTFRPSPLTEADGYMLQSNVQELADFHTLAALLCQLNLAKIIPPGFLDNDTELLLLKARFVFWADTKIYEERSMHYE